jgi:hypothetical protein
MVVGDRFVVDMRSKLLVWWNKLEARRKLSHHFDAGFVRDIYAD